ncbi:MAG: hypothetical protein ACREIG_02675 [Nitrospiraceae bacterium]
MTAWITACSEIEGVVCCASGWAAGSVCAGADCCAGREGVEVVDGTDRAGTWFWVDAVDSTCWVSDTMETFHLNASSCGSS